MSHSPVVSVRIIFALFLLVFSPFSQAQVTPITVGAVSSTLQDALSGFNLTIRTAGAEARSTGASLWGNAQNVITDLDRQLGGRLTTSIDQLSGIEHQLADDAILLTKQIKDAGIAVAINAGDEARRTIAEADITAYNASYSLPCRTLTPRIVYFWPRSIRCGTGPAEIHLKGNILDVGAMPSVTVGGETADIIGRNRNRNELIVRVPTKVMNSLITQQYSLDSKSLVRLGIPCARSGLRAGRHTSGQNGLGS